MGVRYPHIAADFVLILFNFIKYFWLKLAVFGQFKIITLTADLACSRKHQHQKS